MRVFLMIAAVVLAGCGPSEPAHPPKDLTLEPWYGETAIQVAAMARQAEERLQSGHLDEAAALISNGQPFANRLLTASRPTLAAMEAISDLDQQYGLMLIENKYYGEARMLFQKNAIRWRTWKPQTPESERRLKLAQTAIAECDRLLTK